VYTAASARNVRIRTQFKLPPERLMNGLNSQTPAKRQRPTASALWLERAKICREIGNAFIAELGDPDGEHLFIF
jgi:hypothetical protein